ncbi:MAG: 4Fe-4S dicluster domain-containing protein [Chloroflexi bacterium]|nr:4Fe-4S dicluster domain-containing protein [Chloroflexota bacterium]
MTARTYAERRFMRALERTWALIEGVVNRYSKSDFNPLPHLGTLTILLLVVLIVTGIYLTIYYRPGSDVAFATVETLSSNWFGQLMRSIHRYASDGMIVLILLHFIKMLVSDRFWGQRWLAWTSGWLMLATTWLVGTMGFWLIWDQRAQWMTEYMMRTVAGGSGLTYVANDLAARTFSNFVIILFLHVFLPLIGFLGVYIHSLRLSRARWWSPRWAIAQTLAGLIILSLIKPSTSSAQADLSRFISNVPMDAFYLGFLPIIDAWGNLIFWSLAILVGGTCFLLPWIFKGKDLGPAVITNDKCTGCNICFAECPFDAIRMAPRSDATGFQKLAVIIERQCTGCGICVGACPEDAVELAGGFNGDQLFNAIKGALRREQEEGNEGTVLFASQRDLSLGGLPPACITHAPVTTCTWNGRFRLVTAILPTASTINIDWIKVLPQEGARAIVILSHPYDDGIFREDSHWILNRLHLRPALISGDLHWLETTPGDSTTVTNFLDGLHESELKDRERSPTLPPVKGRYKLIPSISGGLAGIFLMLALFSIALPLDIRSGMKDADGSGLRIAVDAKGKIEVAAIPEGFTLPEGADAEKIFGGQHYPMEIMVTVDGKDALKEIYQPSGLSGNGRISALDFLTIEPGSHEILINIRDDNAVFRTVFSDSVTFEQGAIRVLAYDEGKDEFIMR